MPVSSGIVLLWPKIHFMQNDLIPNSSAGLSTPRKLTNLLFFGLCLSAFALPAQSPWTRSKGGFYAQAGYHFIPTYDTYFGVQNSAEYKLDREVSEATFQFYGEYGLAKKTTLVVNLPFRVVETGRPVDGRPLPNQQPRNAPGKLSGLGNASLALRQNFYSKDGFTASGTLRVDVPTDRYNNSTGLRLGYDAWTIMPIASAGVGYRKAYMFGYMGFGYRTNDYSHLYLLGAEGGYHLKNLWLIGYSELLSPFANGTVQAPFNNQLTRLFVDKQGYWSLGLKGIYEVNRFVGVLVYGAGVFYAEQLPKSPGLGAGIYFKWD